MDAGRIQEPANPWRQAGLMTAVAPIIGANAAITVQPPPINDRRPATPPPKSIGPQVSSGGGGLGRTLADGATLLAAQETANGSQLSEEDKQTVAKLKKRDAEVRQHEQAHARAGGQFTGAPSFSYERGPDGRSYAVGGEVPIDTSPVANDPAATARKMQTVQQAALAPAEPSSQDRAIAARAASQKLQAQAEVAAQRADALQEPRGTEDPNASPSTTGGPEAVGGKADANDVIQTIGLIA